MIASDSKKEKDRIAYTLDQFLNDIQLSSDNYSEKDGSESIREHTSKIIVIQMLAELAKEISNNTNYISAVKCKLNQNEILSGYMFFVSQNPQFNYSWNYMRKCKTEYGKFLINAVVFLNQVIEDINLIAGKMIQKDDIHVVFNDLIDIECLKEFPYVRSRLIWDNFNRIIKSKEEYEIKVKVKNFILIVGRRKEIKDTEKIVSVVFDKFDDTTTVKI